MGVGCCEARRLLAEGDPLCAVRWASGSCKMPWALENAEEVIDFGKALAGTFLCIKTSATCASVSKGGISSSNFVNKSRWSSVHFGLRLCLYAWCFL